MTSRMSPVPKGQKSSQVGGTTAFVKLSYSKLTPNCVLVMPILSFFFFFTITIFKHFIVCSSKYHLLAGILNREPLTPSCTQLCGKSTVAFEYLKYVGFFNEPR